MFAIITPAIISGAIADRAKFTSWAVFVAIWSTLVYFPVAHWVFAFGNKVGDTVTGAGFLARQGLEDFAGGTAVHINAGAAALALAIVLGKRVGWRKESMRPHSLPLVMLGSGLLWFGWFGFNAGSALAANGVAALALMNTQVAAAAALAGWLLVEKNSSGTSNITRRSIWSCCRFSSNYSCMCFRRTVGSSCHWFTCRSSVLARNWLEISI
jgi:ammonium transporter, Amt family